MKKFTGTMILFLMLGVFIAIAAYTFYFLYNSSPADLQQRLQELTGNLGKKDTATPSPTMNDVVSDEPDELIKDDAHSNGSSTTPVPVSPKPDKAISRNNGTTQPKQEKKEDFFLTFNELLGIQNMSLVDKLVALSIVQKLNQKEINTALDLANGGITTEEMDTLKGLLKNRLSEEDIEKLNQIALRNKKLYAEGKLTN